MGSGRGGGPSFDDLERLEELARKKLRQAAGRRNVFISFAAEDKPLVELLRGQAKKEDSTLEFNDWSLREPFDSKRADYIRQGIRERIRQSSVTLVYVSEHTASSKWVNWEIKESLKLGNKVVPVYQGTPPRQIPPAIREHNIRLVPWSQEGLAKELR